MRPSYFETQYLEYCAIHAMNNLFQQKMITIEFMNRVSLDMNLVDKDTNRFSVTTGNYNNDVIEKALELYGFIIEPRWQFNLNNFANMVDSGVPFMIIITQENHHYSLRRFTKASEIWLFDSKMPLPIAETSQHFLHHIKKQYTSTHIQSVPQIIYVFENGYATQLPRAEFKIYSIIDTTVYQIPSYQKYQFMSITSSDIESNNKTFNPDSNSKNISLFNSNLAGNNESSMLNKLVILIFH